MVVRATPSARWLALALLAAVGAEGASWLALHVLEARRGLRYRTHAELLDETQRERITRVLEIDGLAYQRIDAELGWVVRAAASSGGGATSNAQGLRARREYAPDVPPGVVRIAAFGDSFVHGDEVADDETWAALLEASRGDLELLNFGVSGYGLDQALLRYRAEAARFRPDVVVIGVIADDVLRGTSVYRPFLAPETWHVLTKPRFLLGRDGALELAPNPLRSHDDYRRLLADPARVVPEMIEHDAYAPPASPAGPLDALATVRVVKLLHATLSRPGDGAPATRRGVLDLDAEVVRLAAATLRAFAREVHAAGAEPLIVFFPDVTEIDAAREGRPITYRPLLERLAADGLPVVDALDAFTSDPDALRRDEQLRGSHYSPRANRLVARYLGTELERRGLIGARERFSTGARSGSLLPGAA